MESVNSQIRSLLFSLIIFLNLFGALLNEIVNLLGIPPIFTIIKTAASFFILFLIPLNRRNIFALITLATFACTYVIIGLIQARLLPSLYFVRLYAEPLIIMLWISSYVTVNNYSEILKALFKIFLLFAVTGIITFFLLNFTSTLSLIIENEKIITPDWFITYTKIIRSGLPIGAPNSTGFIGIGVLGFLTLKYNEIIKYVSTKTVWLLIGLTSLNTLLSFSKSAMGAFILFFIIIHIFQLEIKRVLKFIIAILSLLFLFYLIIPENEISSIVRLLNSFSSLGDSSSLGHIESFNKGLNLVKENWFLGVDKGSWGTKARLFPGDMGNVESSILLLIIDLGFLGFILYSLFFLIILIESWKINKHILLFIILISPPLLVLPLIQELEAMMIIYILLAFIKIKNIE